MLCYNRGSLRPSVRVGLRRGVAQPGRAPGSGPGGRRFKSSLPDHLFQQLTINFWFVALTAVGEFEAEKASKINKQNSLNECPLAHRIIECKNPSAQCTIEAP